MVKVLLSDFERAFSDHTPRLVKEAKTRAAVAIVLRADEPHSQGPEVLLIERAQRQGDPWSGHMAFPGGRQDRGESLEGTAIRETIEEVGLDLEGSPVLGRLDDLTGRRTGREGLVISAFVFRFEGASRALRLNHEVASAHWVALRALLDPDRQVEYQYRGFDELFPGTVVGHPERHVVWGLTHRFLQSFFATVGVCFPPRL